MSQKLNVDSPTALGANLIDVWATYWLKEWENDPLPDVHASEIDPRVVLTHEPERGRVAV